MLDIEREFSKTDLNVFKKAPIDKFAEGICKYRLFSVKDALENITHIGYSEASAKVAFCALSRYLITGQLPKTSVSKQLFKAVDKFKNIYPALTPKENQKRRVVDQPLRGKYKKNTDERILPLPECHQTTEKFSYAVKLNHNTYKVFNTEKEFEAFKDALVLVGKQDEYKYVHLRIEEV